MLNFFIEVLVRAKMLYRGHKHCLIADSEGVVALSKRAALPKTLDLVAYVPN